jgi:hypothetical protein
VLRGSSKHIPPLRRQAIVSVKTGISGFMKKSLRFLGEPQALNDNFLGLIV